MAVNKVFSINVLMKIWWMVYYGLTESSQTLLAPTMDKYWFLLIQNSTSLILRKKVKSLNILIYILYTIYILYSTYGYDKIWSQNNYAMLSEVW